MIIITERAIQGLKHLLEISPVKGSTVGFRFGVKAGACSGFLYIPLSIVAKPNEKDSVFESQGIRIFVDPKSFPLVDGTEIDKSDNIFEGFIFNNPNAKSACGCGISFELK